MAVGILEVPEDVIRETLDARIPVNLIFWEPAYGRRPKKERQAFLMSNWDRESVGVIYVSLRHDGRYAAIDGWHRVCACRAIEGESATLPARVYIDKTIEEEARLYAAFNGDRKAPTPIEIFRSRLVSRQSRAMAILQTVERAGLTLALDDSGHLGDIKAITALEKVWSSLGAEQTELLLSLLTEAFGRRPQAYEGTILKGMAAFWRRYLGPPRSIANQQRLVNVLGAQTPQMLLAQAYHLKGSPVAPAIDICVGQVIWGLYNKGLRSGRLPDWPSRAFGEGGRESLRVREAKKRAGLDKEKSLTA